MVVFIESFEDTNEVIRELCWREQWSSKSTLLKTPSSNKSTVQDGFSVHQDEKGVGFEYIVKKFKSWRISTVKILAPTRLAATYVFTWIIWSMGLCFS